MGEPQGPAPYPKAFALHALSLCQKLQTWTLDLSCQVPGHPFLLPSAQEILNLKELHSWDMSAGPPIPAGCSAHPSQQLHSPCWAESDLQVGAASGPAAALAEGLEPPDVP